MEKEGVKKLRKNYVSNLRYILRYVSLKEGSIWLVRDGINILTISCSTAENNYTEVQKGKNNLHFEAYLSIKLKLAKL